MQMVAGWGAVPQCTSRGRQCFWRPEWRLLSTLHTLCMWTGVWPRSVLTLCPHPATGSSPNTGKMFRTHRCSDRMWCDEHVWHHVFISTAGVWWTAFCRALPPDSFLEKKKEDSVSASKLSSSVIGLELRYSAGWRLACQSTVSHQSTVWVSELLQQKLNFSPTSIIVNISTISSTKSQMRSSLFL